MRSRRILPRRRLAIITRPISTISTRCRARSADRDRAQAGRTRRLRGSDSYYKDIHNDLPQILKEIGARTGLTFSNRRIHLRSMSDMNPGRKTYERPSGATEAVVCFTKPRLGRLVSRKAASDNQGRFLVAGLSVEGLDRQVDKVGRIRTGGPHNLRNDPRFRASSSESPRREAAGASLGHRSGRSL